MRKDIVALILEKNGSFLVEKRKLAKSTDPGKCVFPSGHVHKNENLEDAVRREAFEELNIKLNNLEFICERKFDGPEEKQRIRWYWCDDFSGEMQNNEAEELFWIGPTETEKLTYQVSRDALEAFLVRKEKKIV